MWRDDSFEKTLMWEKKLRAGGEGDDRGWDGWMASPTQWTWVWLDSGSWWWTGRPGILQSMGSQRVGHDWVTELNWKLVFRDYEVSSTETLSSWRAAANVTFMSWFLLSIKMRKRWVVSHLIPLTMLFTTRLIILQIVTEVMLCMTVVVLLRRNVPIIELLKMWALR